MSKCVFRPILGLGWFALEIHGFTVGYRRSLLRSFKWILKTRHNVFNCFVKHEGLQAGKG
jgi:hypothetical protein